jgi:hypothetical protein
MNALQRQESLKRICQLSASSKAAGRLFASRNTNAGGTRRHCEHVATRQSLREGTAASHHLCGSITHGVREKSTTSSMDAQAEMASPAKLSKAPSAAAAAKRTGHC